MITWLSFSENSLAISKTDTGASSGNQQLCFVIFSFYLKFYCFNLSGLFFPYYIPIGILLVKKIYLTCPINVPMIA